MLAIVFAMEKLNDYTLDKKTVVFSDHKPLESILMKPLHCAPKCLQRMIIELIYTFQSLEFQKVN